MEDSSWQGWTTPQPSGPLLAYPEGRKLPRGPPGGWLGALRTMPKANDDTIRFASRNWPQVRRNDFERDGRRFTQRSTGVQYDLCRRNVLLADDPELADCFFVEGDSLLFLRRADRPSGVRSTWIGEMGAVR